MAKDFCSGSTCGFLKEIVYEEIQGKKTFKLCKDCVDMKTKLADSFVGLFGGKKPVDVTEQTRAAWAAYQAKQLQTMPPPSDDVLWAKAVRRAFRIGFIFGLIVASFATWLAVYLLVFGGLSGFGV